MFGEIKMFIISKLFVEEFAMFIYVFYLLRKDVKM